MKRTLFLAVCVFLISVFAANSVLASGVEACSIVSSHSEPKAAFCSDFNSDAICACKAEEQKPSICNGGAKTIYADLVQPLGIPLACRLHTPGGMSYQECVDQWDCYMFGTVGNPSDGECFGQRSVSGC